MRRKDKVVYRDLDPNSHLQEPDFILFDFLDELSEDARLVVKLTLETPHGLAVCMQQQGGKPWTIRRVIREYLVAMEWTTQRVTETFLEIRRAL